MSRVSGRSALIGCEAAARMVGLLLLQQAAVERWTLLMSCVTCRATPARATCRYRLTSTTLSHAAVTSSSGPAAEATPTDSRRSATVNSDVSTSRRERHPLRRRPLPPYQPVRPQTLNILSRLSTSNQNIRRF